MINKFYVELFDLEVNNWWFRSLYDLVLRYTKKLFKKNFSTIKVLYLGTGTCHLIELLNRIGVGNVYGFDPSPHAITFCRKRGLSNVWVQNFADWSPNPQEYDMIINLNTLTHRIYMADEQQIIRKINYALRPYGYVIVNWPVRETGQLVFKHSQFEHKRLDPRYFVRMMKSNGFRVRYSTYRLPLYGLFVVLNKIFGYEDHLVPMSKTWNNFLMKYALAENALLSLGCRFLWGSSFFLVAQKRMVEI